MAKRRKNHEGYIRYRDSRKHYEGRITVDGKPKYFTGATSQEVQDKMLEFRNAIRSGIDISKQSKLDEVFDKFCSVKSRVVSVKTLGAYKSQYATHIMPHIGSKKISDVTPTSLNNYVDMLISNNLTPSQINRSIKLLKSVFSHAQRIQLISNNPAQFIQGVKNSRKKMRALDQGEIKAFVKSARKDKHFALWFLLLNVGCRIGESLALTWDDLNFETDELTISKTYDQDYGISDGTKNGESRTVKLNGTLMKVLQKHHSEQLERQLKMSNYWENKNLIFTNDIGGYIHLGNLRRRNFNAILKDAGISNFRIHDLRHSFASHSLSNNIPVVEVSHYIGHKSPTVTLDVYSHYIPKEESKVSQIMENIINA